MIKLTDILPESSIKSNRLHLLMAWLFLALFAFPLFPLHVTNAILLFLAITTLIAFFIKPLPVGKTLLLNLVFVIPFVPYLLEFCFSGFDPIVRFEFEKKLFFFTAPFIIPVFIKVTGFKNYKLALLIFALSVTILTIYSIAILLIKGIPFLPSAYENGAYLLRYNFEQISNLHPTYYSIFAMISCSFLLNASKTSNRFNSGVFIGFSILLIIIILFLSARIALIAGAVLLLVWILNSKMTSLKKFTLIYCSLVLLILIAFTIPSARNRLNEVINLKTSQFTPGNTVSQRILIMDCSLKSFTENIFFGSGSGHFQKKLDDCYSSKGWQAGADESFNPHNQFLSIGVAYGLIMLMVFIASLVLIFRKILKLPIGKYYCIALVLFFMSESMLEVQMGIYMFGMISLLLYNVSSEPQLNRNP